MEIAFAMMAWMTAVSALGLAGRVKRQQDQIVEVLRALDPALAVKLGEPVPAWTQTPRSWYWIEACLVLGLLVGALFAFVVTGQG